MMKSVDDFEDPLKIPEQQEQEHEQQAEEVGGEPVPLKIGRSITGRRPSDHNLAGNVNTIDPLASHDEDQDNNNGTTGTNTPAKKKKLIPLELAQGDDDDLDDDMESLLPSSATFARRSNSRNNSVVIPNNNNNNNNNDDNNNMHSPTCPKRKQLPRGTKTYLFGTIRPQPIGNMNIIFPEYFDSSGWGVLGPHWFGPACVWGILIVASHFCLRKSYHMGILSVIICFAFFAASTFFLTDVSLRDPGICLATEIPADTPAHQIRQWRWCDFCHCFQPPDGAHCPECNVCVAGYDHHCVWMGTCIGKKNYKQFIRFNVCWLYYLGFAFFWLATFGPLFKGDYNE